MPQSLMSGIVIIAGFTSGCGGNDDPGGPTTVLVEGQVISSRSRAGIAGATVSIGNILGNDFVTTTTDTDGRFSANAEYFVCDGVYIFAVHTGYAQPTPFPNVCPGSSRTIELDPKATTSLITPQDPSVAVNGTVDFHVRVTFFDGTVEDEGEAVWLIGADGDVGDGSVCGTLPDVGAVQGTTYTAPPAPPPTGCGGLAGQAAVVAAPTDDAGGTLDASDTVVVTVTP